MIINYLLQQKEEINSLDETGTSPLHDSVKYGQIKAVEILINNKADINIKDKDNFLGIIWLDPSSLGSK